MCNMYIYIYVPTFSLLMVHGTWIYILATFIESHAWKTIKGSKACNCKL